MAITICISDILSTILVGKRIRRTNVHGETVEGVVRSVTFINASSGTFALCLDEKDWKSSEQLSDPVIFAGTNDDFEIL
jgi:3-deoxy-D-arabino-heptulosonate 7-phosphate (DAHP) synthase